MPTFSRLYLSSVGTFSQSFSKYCIITRRTWQSLSSLAASSVLVPTVLQSSPFPTPLLQILASVLSHSKGIHLLILASRYESVTIASILPTCAFSPVPIILAVCVYQDLRAVLLKLFLLGTYVYQSTIGESSSRHFQQKYTEFTLLSSLHTTPYFVTFAVTLHSFPSLL